MPKRESLVDVDLFGDATDSTKTPSRRHKRHHHRKHKKKKPNQTDGPIDGGDSDAVDVVNDIPDDSPPLVGGGGALQPPQDLNITPARPSTSIRSHYGTPTASSAANSNSTRSTPSAMSSASIASAAAAAKRKRARNNKADSGTSSEEERWLDAIESGKLEQVDDEMKKLKDPKLMTARQRAMYERSTAATASANTTTASHALADSSTPEMFGLTGGAAHGGGVGAGVEQLYALPSGYKETKVLTAEDIEKALIKSQKRKQLADEKREKNKRKTMEKLLKKKDYKATAKANKLRPTPVEVPMISWRSDATGTTITFPTGVELPLIDVQRAAREPPIAPKACVICGEPKRYNCSRTHVPLCSFECYKKKGAQTEANFVLV